MTLDTSPVGDWFRAFEMTTKAETFCTKRALSPRASKYSVGISKLSGVRERIIYTILSFSRKYGIPLCYTNGMRFCLTCLLFFSSPITGISAWAAGPTKPGCEHLLSPENLHGWAVLDLGNEGQLRLLKVPDKVLLTLKTPVTGWPFSYLNGSLLGFTPAGISVSGGFSTDWSNIVAEESYAYDLDATPLPFKEVSSSLLDAVLTSRFAKMGKLPLEADALKIKTPVEIFWKIENGVLITAEDMSDAVELVRLASGTQNPQELIDLFEEHFLLERNNLLVKWRDVFGHTDVAKDGDSKIEFLSKRFPLEL